MKQLHTILADDPSNNNFVMLGKLALLPNAIDPMGGKSLIERSQ